MLIVPIPFKRLFCTAFLLNLLAPQTTCDQKRSFYAASTNGLYHGPIEQRLDTFTVDAQASAYTTAN